MRMLTATFLALVCITATMAQEPLWEADLTEPDGDFSAYNDNEAIDISVIEADGQPMLHVETPGERNLEGPTIVTDPVLPGGQRATITAEVRGSGDVWLMANSRNGWLYSRGTAALTDQWQTLELTKPLALADDRMTIALLTREAAPMTLEVRSLQVTVEPAPLTSDLPVPPVRIEAEALAPHARQIEQVEDASGGAVVSGGDYALLAGVPTPHTSRPIYVFGRARMAGADASWSARIDTGGGVQDVASLTGEDTRDWQWIGGGPITAAMAGESFRIQLRGADGAAGESQLDYIVLTTEAEPSDEQLEAALPLALDGPPLLAASRPDAAPTIDGVADEPCWAHSVALTGFTRVNSTIPATHQSQMRLCRDDENLYWWFRGEEPVLRPEMNRLHDFLQNVTERDADLWKDDAVLLILDTGEGIFDFFVNARGAVNDSRIDDPMNMWTARDESFDADFEAASVVEDGYWTVEARIGLDSLGVSPDAADRWRFIAGRMEQADEETSAWNLCAPGLHDPTAFADLTFADDAPGAVVSLPEPLQPGSNDVRADLSGAERGALLGTAVSEDGAASREWSFGHGDGEAVAALPVEEEGQLQFNYALLDGVALNPLLVSPDYEASVRSSRATVALATDAPWTLLVNGQRVASGAEASADEPIEVFLQKGVNALGLELEGEAQVRVEAGDLTVSNEDPWRVAPEGVGDASAPELDPREWEVASGERLGPGTFRFTVLWEDTHTFPTSRPALFIAQGAPQHFTVAAQGLPGHLLEGYRCHFWLPEALELVEATGYYATREEQPEYTVERLGEEQIDGETRAHYVVTADQPIPHSDSVRILELFNVFFAWREGVAVEDRDYPVYYAAEALGGSAREARRQMAVRPLPPLEGEQPERLVMQLWGSFFNAMNKGEAKALTMETMQAAGFNNIVSGDLETSEIGDGYGVDNVLSVNFESWSIGMRPWLEEHSDAALVDRAGEESASYVCPISLLTDAADHAQDRLREMIAERRPDYVTWDFESNVMTGYLSCFCPDCLEAFREEAGIAADVALDPESIEHEHFDEWTEFMTLRMARVGAMLKEACHTAEPPVLMQIYSGYQSPETKWRYGVDWAKIGELESCDIASCGYGRNAERLSATHEALGEIPLIVGRLMRPYDRNSTEEVSPLTRAIMLRRLMDCTGGVLVYDRMPFEGRSWAAFAEVSRLAAAHEDVFAEGEFVEIDGIDFAQDWAGARSLGDTMIVAMMNTANADRTLSLTLPDGYATCSEFFSGEAAASGDEITLELAPGEARAWVLTR
ncbi:MAG: hypothetical protein ACLFU7_12545, partial [Armatimonadota bacterium]